VHRVDAIVCVYSAMRTVRYNFSASPRCRVTTLVTRIVIRDVRAQRVVDMHITHNALAKLRGHLTRLKKIPGSRHARVHIN
jgi:hypothetical protein